MINCVQNDFPWYAFCAIMAFVWGACIGSFLNVCIYRIPRGLSIVKPRSFCPHCKTPIPWYCNVPLVSFVLLRARCAFCGNRINARYVLVELLMGVLFLLAWLKYDPGRGPPPLGLVPARELALVPVYWLIMSGLVLGTFVDLEHLIIPDRVTLGGIVAGFCLSILVPALHGQDGALRAMGWSAIGIAAGAGLLWVLAFLGRLAFRKEAMGLGDVKLLGAVGAFLGPQAVFFTVLLSSLAGSIVGIALIMLRRKRMGSRIPYGPYLALAAVVWILWGPNLWDFYLDAFTPKLLPYPQ